MDSKRAESSDSSSKDVTKAPSELGDSLEERAAGTSSAPRRQPLAPGESAPLFFLATATGAELALAALVVRGPVLLDFIRGSWDPDARKRLNELASEHGMFKDLGAQVVAVTCERPAPLIDYVNRTHLPFSVAIDADRSVTKAYGVFQRFALPLWNIARPSTFLIDTCGFVRYAFTARLSIHAAELDEVRDAIRTLSTR